MCCACKNKCALHAVEMLLCVVTSRAGFKTTHHARHIHHRYKALALSVDSVHFIDSCAFICRSGCWTDIVSYSCLNSFGTARERLIKANFRILDDVSVSCEKPKRHSPPSLFSFYFWSLKGKELPVFEANHRGCFQESQEKIPAYLHHDFALTNSRTYWYLFLLHLFIQSQR